MLSYVAITFTMFLGLVLSSVTAAQKYILHFEILLIGINISVVVFTLYLTIAPVCKALVDKYKTSKEKKRRRTSMNKLNANIFGKNKSLTAVLPTRGEVNGSTQQKAKQFWNNSGERS